jgi:hypothetical protein
MMWVVMNPDGKLGEDYQQVITNHDAKALA